MLNKLRNRFWIRPQLWTAAWLNATEPHDWDVPPVLLNKKGAAALIIGAIDFIICALALSILGYDEKKYRWEDSKRCKSIEDFVEKKGLIKGPFTGADRYYYFKIYIHAAQKFVTEKQLEPDVMNLHLQAISLAEDKIKEVYEEALILELAEVEK